MKLEYFYNQSYPLGLWRGKIVPFDNCNASVVLVIEDKAINDRNKDRVISISN